MSLQSQIMNLQYPTDSKLKHSIAYKIGHRDALDAAAAVAVSAKKLVDALKTIAEQDPIEMALDPQWAARVARITLTECGYNNERP